MKNYIIILLSLIVQPFMLAAYTPTNQATRDPRIRANFVWEMEERYGLDENNNGRIDLLNTTEYANPGIVPNSINTSPRFKVEFRTILGDAYRPLATDLSATQSQQGANYQRWKNATSIRLTRYELRRRGRIIASGSLVLGNPDLVISTLLHERKYDITLYIEGVNRDGQIVYNTSTEAVEIEDIFIVALGDSYSSGEGNPEQPKTALPADEMWADGKKTVTYSGGVATIHQTLAQKRNFKARRSSLCWSSQAALELEKSDPHSSVTYINLSSSGATIEEGILGTQYYEDREKCGDLALSYPDYTLPSQISQLREIAAGRTIDHITMSIGGNDAGFSAIVTALVLRENGVTAGFFDGDLEDFMLGFVKNGQWPMYATMRDMTSIPITGWKGNFKVVPGMDRLSDLYVELERQLRPFVKPRHTQVYMMEYPNSLYNRNGQLACNQILGRVQSGLEIDQEEMKFSIREVINPLNRKIKSFCSRSSNWHYIKGISQAYKGHAICEPKAPYRRSTSAFPQPFDLNRDYRWIRAFKESCDIIGDSYGAMHPNDYGHFAIKNQLMKVWTQPFDKERLHIVKKDTNHLFVDLMNMSVNQRSGHWGVGGPIGARYSLYYASNFPDLLRVPEYEIKIKVKVLKDARGNTLPRPIILNVAPGRQLAENHSKTILKRENNRLRIIFKDVNGTFPKDENGNFISYQNLARLELTYSVIRAGLPTKEKKIIAWKPRTHPVNDKILYEMRPFENVLIDPVEQIMVLKKGQKEITLPLQYGRDNQLNTSSQLLVKNLSQGAVVKELRAPVSKTQKGQVRTPASKFQQKSNIKVQTQVKKSSPVQKLPAKNKQLNIQKTVGKKPLNQSIKRKNNN